MLEPVDRSSGNIQGEFGPDSGSGGYDAYFKARITPDQSQNLELLYKDSGSKTYTQEESVQIYPEYENTDYYIGTASSTIGLSEGQSSTFTIDGDEHTIELVSVNEYSDGPEIVGYKVDAGTLQTRDEGEYFSIDGHWIWIYDASSPGSADFEIIEPITMPQYESSYRVKYGSRYSNPIYTSVHDTWETPVITKARSDGKRIYDFNRTGGIAPTSTISGQVYQREGDDYNVSLYDNSNGLVAYANTNGSADNVYVNVVKDTFYDLGEVFLDLDQQNTLQFPTAGSSLLEASDQNDDFYFKIEDIDDGQSRLTHVYQTHTSGTNDAPNITGIEGFNGSSWKDLTQFQSFNESLDRVRIQVEDQNNEFHQAQLYLEDQYDTNIRANWSTDHSISGDYYTWNISNRTDDSGDWVAKFNVTDGDKYDSETVNWSIPWGSLSVQNFTVNGSTSSTTVTTEDSFYVNATLHCEGGECASETNGTHNTTEWTENWLDPVKILENGSTKDLEPIHVKAKGPISDGDTHQFTARPGDTVKIGLENEEQLQVENGERDRPAWKTSLENLLTWLIEGDLF